MEILMILTVVTQTVSLKPAGVTRTLILVGSIVPQPHQSVMMVCEYLVKGVMMMKTMG